MKDLLDMIHVMRADSKNISENKKGLRHVYEKKTTYTYISSIYI